MGIPLRIPGERMTEIIKMKVDELLDRFEDRLDNVFPDNVFPGTEDPPPGQRLQKYLESITDVSDIALLSDPDYIAQYQMGQAPAPRSQYWITALSIPSEFESMQKDFMKLLIKEPV